MPRRTRCRRLLPAIVIVACIFLAACQEEKKPDPLSGVRALDMFLLIGQSNMAGRGVIEDVDRTANPNIKTLSIDGEWVPAIDPIHFDKPIAGVGPGRSFARGVLEADRSRTIGLIPSAVGGSPISTWEAGAYYESTDSHPYDDAIKRAKEAMEHGEIKAVLWHQGESDSKAELAPLYKDKLITLIDRLRVDLGNPDLPFLIGQLGQFEDVHWDEWQTMVNAAHEDVAREMAHVYFVPSDGLGHKGDSLHFSAEASREFGRRYAHVYNEEISSQP